MDLACEGVDLLGQLRVLVDQLLDQVDAGLCEGLALERGIGDRLPVFRVRFRECLVAIGLASLGEQDQRRRIRSLKAEARLRRMNG